MKIQAFWNRAFLAALARLSAEEAKTEADRATDLCIKQWQDQRWHWIGPDVRKWMEYYIAEVPVGQPRISEGPGASSAS